MTCMITSTTRVRFWWAALSSDRDPGAEGSINLVSVTNILDEPVK